MEADVPRERAPALDISILHALIGEDPAVVAEIMATYLGSIGSAAVDLRHAMLARDPQRVRAAAHLIKSPSLSVGAVPLGRLCAMLELAAANADWKTLHDGFAVFDATLASVELAARHCIASASRS